MGKLRDRLERRLISHDQLAAFRDDLIEMCQRLGFEPSPFLAADEKLMVYLIALRNHFDNRLRELELEQLAPLMDDAAAPGIGDHPAATSRDVGGDELPATGVNILDDDQLEEVVRNMEPATSAARLATGDGPVTGKLAPTPILCFFCDREIPRGNPIYAAPDNNACCESCYREYLAREGGR